MPFAKCPDPHILNQPIGVLTVAMNINHHGRAPLLDSEYVPFDPAKCLMDRDNIGSKPVKSNPDQCDIEKPVLPVILGMPPERQRFSGGVELMEEIKMQGDGLLKQGAAFFFLIGFPA